MARPLFCSFLAAPLVSLAASAALPKPDTDNGGITLPPGFHAVVVADNLGPLRHLTVAPNGDIYAKSRESGLIALRDSDGDGHADIVKRFGSGSGTGAVLHDGWLYYSTNSRVYRYRLTPGELVPSGEPELIVKDLPDEGQHNAKSFTFGTDGALYVEVGSPSNAFGTPDRAPGAKGGDPTEFLKTHGGIWRFDPDKAGQTQSDGLHYTTGQRHIVALTWNPIVNALFGVQHGRDQLHTVAPQYFDDEASAELPAEEMHVLRQGSNLGWPFTYYDPMRKQRMVAPEYGGDGKKAAEAGKYPEPLVAFPAHWAPLDIVFYTAKQYPEKYHGGAFVTFQGSWNRAPKPQKGYNVAFVPCDEHGMPRGTYEIFADGFAGMKEVPSPGDARFRPCGIALGPDGSLYVSDAQKGRLWRIFYTGD